MEMPDTVFVYGLNEDVTEEALIQHFGSIGVIKVKAKFDFCLMCIFFSHVFEVVD